MPAISDEYVLEILPSPEECRTVAIDLRKRHPGGAPELLVKKAISDAKFGAGLWGAATGLVGNPVVFAAVGMADLRAQLRTEALLVGTIGAILAPQVLEDGDEFTRHVLVVMFPGLVSRLVGVSVPRLTAHWVRTRGGTIALVALARLIAKYLIPKLSRRALTRFVPLLGGALGAWMNRSDVKKVGGRARLYFSEQQA